MTKGPPGGLGKGHCGDFLRRTCPAFGGPPGPWDPTGRGRGAAGARVLVGVGPAAVCWLSESSVVKFHVSPVPGQAPEPHPVPRAAWSPPRPEPSHWKD